MSEGLRNIPERNGMGQVLSTLKEVIQKNVFLSDKVRYGGVCFTDIDVLGVEDPASMVVTERQLSEGMAIKEFAQQMDVVKSVAVHKGWDDVRANVELLMGTRYLSMEKMSYDVFTKVLSVLEGMKEDEKLTLVGFGDNGEAFCASLIDLAMADPVYEDVTKTINAYLKSYLIVARDDGDMVNRPKGPVLRLGLTNENESFGSDPTINDICLVGFDDNCIYKIGLDEIVLGPVEIRQDSVNKANELYEEISQKIFGGMAVVRPAILNPISIQSEEKKVSNPNKRTPWWKR